MNVESRTATNEAEIRNLVEDWAQAIRAKDIERGLVHYARDLLSFDAVYQLQFKGIDAYRKHWQRCFAECTGDTVFEVHDLGVAVDDETALAHFMTRCGAVAPDGTEKTGWMRATFWCRKVDGRWKIAHEHISVPFDPKDGKALFSLKP